MTKNWGPKPFKLFKCWLNHEGFKPFLEDCWNSLSNIRGRPGFILKEKLFKLKHMIRRWNREVFGILDLDVNNAISNLNKLDALVADLERGIAADVCEARGVASKALWDAVNNRESILRQKSRSKWISEGNVNSKYFHRMMKGRWRRNNIVGLNSADGFLSEVDEI